jgi:hypothetical protein
MSWVTARVALISGAAHGQGRSHATTLATEGAVGFLKVEPWPGA